MPRGRKEGSLSGKRAIFWLCVSNHSNELIVEKIYSPNSSSDEEVKDFTEDKASEAFEISHGIKPSKIIGPCYDVKSLSKDKIIKNSVINKKIEDPKKTNISSILGSGVYNGWKGMVFSLSGNPSEVLFIASERVDSNNNKILPSATPIKKELVTILME